MNKGEDMDRKEYWNENYVKYWKDKVEEANLNGKIYINKGDIKTTSDSLIFDLCNSLEFEDNSKILDFGCGFCRLYENFKHKSVQYYGIDISSAMVEESIRNYPELKDRLLVSEGEKLPFENETFDIIVCFGVFDACYQEKALKEILRVLKVGGKVILTGKNYKYFSEDEKALVAEKNARAKGHPNYFTDVHSMISQIIEQGIVIRDQFYFPKRGDFQDMKYYKEIQDQFYEYLLILEKQKSINKDFNKFSYEYSNTFRELK